ncbi:MAG: N-acetylglucosamine-6-phosphate deacetylase [Stappiaceae bacterium]
MTGITAFTGARIFDGESWHNRHALLVDQGSVVGIVETGSLPENCDLHPSRAAFIVPGFVDLQVNGGGGVLLNDVPTCEGIQTICAAHARFGTTALLPTLITDTPEVTDQAIAAGSAAFAENVPGFLGLHLEGPHLSKARKGAHEEQLIRVMEPLDLQRLLSARKKLNNLMTTVAPESVTPDQVAQLAEAGIVVSMGHTNTPCNAVDEYVEAGARLVTHLFNAMSAFSHRDPGLVGAALQTGALSAGLIADGFHVDPIAIDVALRAKSGPGRIFLVSDAMSSIGTDLRSFELNGRTIHREGGRLTLADGTLAGADIDMSASVRYLMDHVGVKSEEALRMASTFPAEALGLDTKGRLGKGCDADLIELDESFHVQTTWIGGQKNFSTP